MAGETSYCVIQIQTLPDTKITGLIHKWSCRHSAYGEVARKNLTWHFPVDTLNLFGLPFRKPDENSVIVKILLRCITGLIFHTETCCVLQTNESRLYVLCILHGVYKDIHTDNLRTKVKKDTKHTTVYCSKLRFC